jgi:hypothetical protein
MQDYGLSHDGDEDVEMAATRAEPIAEGSPPTLWNQTTFIINWKTLELPPLDCL